MVFFHSHCANLSEHKVTIGVIYGSKGTPLSVIRPCRMDVIFNVALDMRGSPHQTIFYLLKGERGRGT